MRINRAGSDELYCGSDVGLGLSQLLPQALGQGCHSILGSRVEMDISVGNNAVSAHAATDDGGLRPNVFLNRQEQGALFDL